MRLFIALELPAEPRAAIGAWQRGWEDPALRAVTAEDLHMTLVFLGSRDPGEVDAIAAAAFSQVDRSAPAAEIEPEPVALPRRGRPRLFALPVRSPGTEALQAQVVAGLAEAGLHEPEPDAQGAASRPFWPHVTVARVRPEKGKRRPAEVGSPPGRMPEQVFAFRPTRLVVFRSDLRRKGARYESMAELELPTADETER